MRCWNIATGQITPGPDDADFYLTISMVVSLFPSQASSGFCQKQPAAGAPAFARVEDVPGDVRHHRAVTPRARP